MLQKEIESKVTQQVKPNRRNMARQIITLKDGTKKNIFHEKKFNGVAFANIKEIWQNWNKAPKPRSKRQQKLQAQTL